MTLKKLYFIGVTTQKSAIFNIFPHWMKVFGIEDARICGIDLPVHSSADSYRGVLKRIKNDDAVGALITTHKIDLYKAAYDMFDEIDENALLLGEVSCISKSKDKLFAFAKDPVASGMALNKFIADDHFLNTGAEVLILGAGGSALAITTYLLSGARHDGFPSRIIIANRSPERLDEARKIFSKYLKDANIVFEIVPEQVTTDKLLEQLTPFSIIINATGLGKDRQGSPLTEKAVFPENAYVWDFNYRGDLLFLRQAYLQQDKHIHIEDGWIYFVHNWLICLEEVFNITITSDMYDACFELALAHRQN